MKYIEELVTYKQDIDAIQIAEILWLSQFMGSESSKVEEKPKSTSDIDDTEIEESIEDEAPEPIDNSTPIHENKKQKYGFDKEQDNGSTYTTNIIQKEKFPKIEKQFQSLKVKQNRISKQLLDEIKTVDYIATTGYFHPIFSEIKSKESYFSLHIIIDKSESMFLWESYTQHFIKSMKFSTIFTHIHIFELDSSQKEPSVCAINSDHSINLNSAIFREEKSITLIFSDITGDGWKSNRMFEVLDKWSKGSFVTIVSMLPKRMWKKTPLRQGISLFMKPRKFLPKNKDLKAEFNFMGIKSDGKGINIPMLTFDSYSFSHLSNVLMSKKDSWVDSRIFKNLVIKEVAKSKKSNITPKERVKNFFSFALPKTRELAVYCSVLPLNQEIIREVIEKRDLGTEKDVFSEFYFGGLIDKDVEATFGEYAFYEGVAKELRQYISVQEMKILLHQVSELMSSSFGVDTKKINLLYESADGSEELNDNEKALVELMIEILEDKGRFYEGEVNRLRENFGSIEKENFLEIEEYNMKTSIVKIETSRGYGIGVLINYNIEDGYSTILTTKHLLYNNIGKLLDVRINNENIDLNKIDSFESYDLAICKMKSQLSHTLLNIENKKSKIGENVKIISYHNNKTYIYNGKIINFKKEDSYEITLEYFRETPLSGSAVIDINTNKLIGIISMSNTRNSNIEAIFIGKVLNLKSSWKLIIKNEQKKPYFKKLQKFLDNEERLGKSILPNKELWFNALDLTPLDKVKVLILGQDPYPIKGHAHGLCFSALDPIEPLPKSLHNIYKELKSDLNIDNFHTANLEPWAKQGVLLLNSILTVEEGKANSHKNVGWEQFTDKIINVVNEQCKNVVFVLWGAYAQKKSKFINESKHLIIKDPHPSPLSAYRGFWDSKPFSRINEYLEENNIEPINWSLKSTIEISSKLNQVILYKEENLNVNLIEIVKYLNKICNYLVFKVGESTFELKDNIVDFSKSYDSLSQSIHDETKDSFASFFFTEKQYNNNYFFEGNTNFDNLMIVSFFGWKSLTTLSYSNSIAYFIAEVISLDLSSYQHQNSTGCLYDFSSNKSDIDKNMREAYICKSCYERISSNKTKENIKILEDIESILKVVGEASKRDLDILEYKEDTYSRFHRISSQLTSKLGRDTIMGREKELQEIDERLNSSNSLLLINGIGGIGKSTIASYYLHTQKDKLDYYGFFEGLENFTSELRESLDLQQEKEDDAFIEALLKLKNLKGNKLLVFDDIKEIEKNQDKIEKILTLKYSGYKILLTSREEIEDINSYYLDALSLEDAKSLFNSIYKVEDEVLLEDVLNYLDGNTFFIEETARVLKSKKTLTLEIIKDKFKNGEFSTIKSIRKESFSDYLNQLFSFTRLNDEEILMLKQLSVLPSIEIEFEFLEEILNRKDDEEFEEILNYLTEKGWISSLENSYKLHQSIKDYIFTTHLPKFEEIESILDYYLTLIANSANPKVTVDNRDKLQFFDAFVDGLKRVGIENEKVANYFNSLGLVYRHLGEYDKALPLSEKALEIKEKILGEESPDTASTYNNLAELYRLKGEYDKALPLSEKALEIREKVLGEEHPDTAQSYNNLALLYKSKGEYDNALPLYEKALEISEKVLGEEHPDTATSYNNLAGLYDSKGEYDKALSLYEKALEIKEKVLGEEHPSTATSYNNLALFYKDRKECKKAKEMFEKCIEVVKKLDYFEISLIELNRALKSVNDSIIKEKKLKFNKKGRYCKEAVAIHSKDNELIEKEKFFQGSDESKLGIQHKSSNFEDIKEIDIKETWNDFNIKQDKKSLTESFTIEFNTSIFDISKEDINPINQGVYGQSVLLWLKEKLPKDMKIEEIDFEDWCWYTYIYCQNEKYMIGASSKGEMDNQHKWSFFMEKQKTSFLKKIIGNKDTNNNCLFYLQNIFMKEKSFENVNVVKEK